MRELPLRAVVRAWDTYLAEENGFESFHVYVSAALLCHFSSTLREMDFQNMVSGILILSFYPAPEGGRGGGERSSGSIPQVLPRVPDALCGGISRDQIVCYNMRGFTI